jgi:predicted transcriptional regulator of viral defense system
MNNNKLKILGPKAAYLVAELHERRKTIFSNSDVAEISNLSQKSARSLVARLVKHGVASRLTPGLFILVPYELGHSREYMGDPYVVAGEIAGNKDYFISHGSAMDIHQMVTQPQLVVYVTTDRSIRPRVVSGTEFRFVRCKPNHFFGITEHWATKTQKIRVSDIERTVIDGLRQSEYCGGFSEVAKGFWMKRQSMNIKKLVEYATRMDIGAVYRRLGFMLEVLDISATEEIRALQNKLTSSYAVLDPILPDEGKFSARWRLKLNVQPEEIKAVIGT